MKAVQEKTKVSVSARRFTSNGDNGFFHWHDKCEVVRPESDFCRFLVDGKILKPSKGDIVFINECAFHQFIYDKPQTTMSFVQFTSDFVTDEGVAFAPIKSHITYEEISKIPDMIKTIDFFWDIIISECKKGNVGNENRYLKATVTAFYNFLLRYFPDNTAVKKDKTKFHEVISYIRNHYDEELTTTEIAKKMYMSRTTLSNLFAKYAGVGMNEYINSLRIKNVNKLLLSDKSITEAAMESGFKSIRTFNHVYRKNMGMTPTEYLDTVVNEIKPNS